MSNDDELLPEYLAESMDFIEEARQALGNLQQGQAPLENLNSIFRAVHTIKGGASIFGFNNTKEWAHKLENLLDGWRKNPDSVKDEQLHQIEKGIDHLQTLIETKDQITESEVQTTSDHESTDAQEFGDLARDLQIVAAEGAPLESPITIPEKVVTKNIHQKTSTPGTSSDKSTGMEMLRVPVSRIQKNLETISEIFLIKNQISYLVENFIKSSQVDHEFIYKWESLDNSLRRSISELESVAMSMRMMPLTGLFSRLEKTVRTYTDEVSKKIKVEKSGDETELDKKVLDALSEPFIHLIRNAMDHGIESPEERNKRGKPTEGLITLKAEVSGNEVMLIISDDGKGLDPEKIKKSAQSKGINTDHVSDELSAQELIFLPGFSTATEVTSTSGRGVGMDVVKTAIQNLGGSITIRSKVNEGTSFIINIPLGMSVVPALIVDINNSLFGIGANEIIETRKIMATDLKSNKGQNFYFYREKFIPCYNLEDLLSARSKNSSYRKNLFICIVKVENEFIAFQVSQLENNTEIVVKELPAFSPNMPYLLGTSLLPNGQPIFVISLKDIYLQKIVSNSKNTPGLPYEQAAS